MKPQWLCKKAKGGYVIVVTYQHNGVKKTLNRAILDVEFEYAKQPKKVVLSVIRMISKELEKL